MASNYTCRLCLRTLRRPNATVSLASRSHSAFRWRWLPAAIGSSGPTTAGSRPRQQHTSSNQPSEAPAAAQQTSGEKSLGERLAETTKERAPGMSEAYIAYQGTLVLLNEAIAQADYTVPSMLERNEDPPKTSRGEHLGEPTTERAVWWYESTGLPPTFNSWAQITFLHMYLLYARIRMFSPAVAPTWQQQLVDHFFHAAEDRMVLMHRLSVRSTRNKYLQDLYQQWGGALLAYDEGLMRGDAALAAALWRNLWMGEAVEGEKLALVTAWMRHMLAALETTSDADVQNGAVRWAHPREQRELVAQQASWWKEDAAPATA